MATIDRGFLVTSAHIEMLRRLPEKVCDAVLGAAFRAAIGLPTESKIKDPTGVLDALIGAICAEAVRFDERGAEKRAKDASRKRKSAMRENAIPPESNGIQRNPTESSGENGGECLLMRGNSDGFRRNPTESDGIRRNPNGKTESTQKEEKEEKEENVCIRTREAPTLGELAAYTETHFGSPHPPREWLAEWLGRMNEGGWINGAGKSLLVRGLWQRELSAWWARDKKNISARAAEQDSAAPSTGAGRVAVPMYTGEIV